MRNALFLVSNLKRVGGIQKYCRKFAAAFSEIGIISKIELKRSTLFQKAIFISKALLRVLTSKPSLIICGHVNFSPVAYFLKKITGIDYVVLVYGVEAWSIKRKIHKKSLREAKKIISISLFTKNKILEQFPEFADKIEILRNPINGERFLINEKPEKLAEKLGVAGCKVILRVSRLSSKEEYKGYEQMLNVLPKVIKEIPSIRYILVGGGDDFTHFNSLLHSAGLSEYIITPGYVADDELIEYYNLCDVFIMLSKSEGLGFVFLEALASGKPVIAGNQDGSGEAILDGELGILVNPDNSDEIAEAIIKTLQGNIDKRLLDSEYLRKKVLDIYGLDTFRERISEIFK